MSEHDIGRPCDFEAASYPIYLRPDLLPFLDLDRLAFLWARERCTQRRDFETGGFEWLQALKKVRRRFGVRLEQVLMVNDTPRKLCRHYGNLIPVIPYEGSKADVLELALLPVFLDTLRARDSVRTIEKRGRRRHPAVKVARRGLDGNA